MCSSVTDFCLHCPRYVKPLRKTMSPPGAAIPFSEFKRELCAAEAHVQRKKTSERKVTNRLLGYAGEVIDRCLKGEGPRLVHSFYV